MVKQAFFKTIKMKKYRALRPFYLGKVEGKDVEVIQNEIIELPEAVGKTMVGNGWMVEVKEEPKEAVKLRKEADKLKTALDKAKAAIEKVKPEAKEKAEADLKALEESYIEADLKATEAEEAETK